MRLPLYIKILGWFMLNLLLLAAGLLFFVESHFGFGLDALISGRAGDQVETASRLILDDLRGKSPDKWGAVLHRYDLAYNVTFSLYGPRGEWLAGGLQELPPGVRAQIERRGPPPRPEDRGGRRAPPPHPLPPRSLVQTANPLRYWAILRVELPDMPPPSPPVALVIESATLSAGGLFFDARPWLAVGVASVLLSALFWLPFVRRITRSIGLMAAATERFAEGDFADPAPVRSHDELGSLAIAINRMSTRLDGYVSGQRRFLGDIAHELCAPLARMQMALGILEQRAGEGERERLEDLREEVDHMSSLVNELLSFSKTSLRGSLVQRQTVDVRRVAERVVQREAPGSPNVTVDMPDHPQALADADLLERALANLVRNALRHASGSAITLVAERDGGEVAVSVRDSGPGVPEETVEKLFDPFFRVDAARTRGSDDLGGVGLGLAIVKTCVTSCGGTVSARNLSPRGFQVTIRLPAASGGKGNCAVGQIPRAEAGDSC